MRILSTVFFLSFLAGKFDAFEQILLTEPIMKKLEHAYFFHDGKIFLQSQSAKNENSNKSTNTKWIVNLALASSPHDQWWIKWGICRLRRCCFFGCNKPWLNSSTCVHELHYLHLNRNFFYSFLSVSACNFSESMSKFNWYFNKFNFYWSYELKILCSCSNFSTRKSQGSEKNKKNH